MAAATAPSSIDLRSSTTFPIRLGPSILKPTASKRYTSVRYNHKPTLSSRGGSTSYVKPAANSSDLELVVKDAGHDYTYSGRETSDGQQYVLVCYGEGKDRYWILEKVDSSQEFNLVKSSTEADPSKLVARYPQIPLENEDEDDLFGDDDELEEPVDDQNPFDFRHFLHSPEVKPKEPTAESRKETPAEKPTTQPLKPAKHAATPPSTAGPSKAKRKLPASSANPSSKSGKSDPKRAKGGASSPRSQQAQPSSRHDIPLLKIDRQASLRGGFEDSGELILENETPVSEKPPRSGAMGLALAGQLGRGPISLRSAANSPASRMESPMAARPAGLDDDDEGEYFLGEASASPESRTARYGKGNDGEDEDMNADADVEDLELPSPARVPQKPSRATSVVVDDDDDLDKQLERAMAEAESDEESEEE